MIENQYFWEIQALAERTWCAIPMVFEFVKNIDFQGLQTPLKFVIFYFFRPPSTVKGLTNNWIINTCWIKIKFISRFLSYLAYWCWRYRYITMEMSKLFTTPGFNVSILYFVVLFSWIISFLATLYYTSAGRVL